MFQWKLLPIIFSLTSYFLIYYYQSLITSNSIFSSSNDSFCYSPFGVIKQLNILSIFFAPFQPPLPLSTSTINSSLRLTLQIFSWLPIGFILLRNNNNRQSCCFSNKSTQFFILLLFIFSSYFIFVLLNLILATSIFYISIWLKIHWIWISHLYQDCCSGLGLLSTSACIWILNQGTAETSLASTLTGVCIIVCLLNSIEIVLAYSNAVGHIGILLVSFVICLIQDKWRLLKCQRRQRISASTSGSGSGSPGNINESLISVSLPLLFEENENNNEEQEEVLPSATNNKSQTKSTVLSSKKHLWIFTLIVSILFISARHIGMNKDLAATISWSNIHDNKFQSYKQPSKPLNVIFAISSSYRPDNPRYLLQTIESILDQLPSQSQSQSNSKSNNNIIPSISIKLLIITYNTQNSPNNNEYSKFINSIESLLKLNSNSKYYVEFINGNNAIKLLLKNMTGSNYYDNIKVPIITSNNNNKNKKAQIRRLRLNFAASLNYALEQNPDADYIFLHEDDFKLCPNSWNWIESTLQFVWHNVPQNCAIFYATGGAGFAINKHIVPNIIRLLTSRTFKNDVPADLILQNCFKGKYTDNINCASCSKNDYGLIISSHLVFEHIGYISSLNHDFYTKEEARWSCGWTHPFNGDSDVGLLWTDVIY